MKTKFGGPYRKPPLGSGINWGLSITNGLKLYCPFNEGAGYQLRNAANNDVAVFSDTGGYAFPTDDYVWGQDEGGLYALNGSSAGSSLHQWVFKASTYYNLTQGMTVAGRCKFVDSGGEFARLIGNYKISDGSSDWAILKHSDNVHWYVFVGGSWGGSTITSVSSVGGIEFIAVTHDGSNVRIYINGILQNTTAASGTLQNTAGNFINIGNCNNGLSSPGKWSKPIYDLYLWNRCLGADELHWLNVNPNGLSYNPKLIWFSADTTVPLTQTASDQIGTMLDSQSNTGNSQGALRFSDVMQLLDAIALIGGNPDFQLQLGDNLNHLVDLPNLIPVILKSFSDTLNNLSDSAAKVMGIPLSAFDSLNNWLDAVSKLLAGYLTKSSSDSMNNLSDSASASLLNVPFLISVADTLNNLNDAVRFWNKLRLVAGDQMVLSDSLRGRMVHLLRLSDILSNFLENVSKDFPVKPSFGDTMTFSDAMAFALTVNLRQSASDTLTLVDGGVVVDNQGTYNPTALINRIRRYLNDPQ